MDILKILSSRRTFIFPTGKNYVPIFNKLLRNNNAQFLNFRSFCVFSSCVLLEKYTNFCLSLVNYVFSYELKILRKYII